MKDFLDFIALLDSLKSYHNVYTLVDGEMSPEPICSLESYDEVDKFIAEHGYQYELQISDMYHYHSDTAQHPQIIIIIE